jgi:hypothetical protein
VRTYFNLGWVSSLLQPEPNTHSNSIYEGWDFDSINLWKSYSNCPHLANFEQQKLSRIEGNNILLFCSITNF